MIALTRDEFFARPHLKTEEVPLPQFGEDRGVIIKQFGARQRLHLSSKWSHLSGVDTNDVNGNAEKMYKFWAEVAGMSMVDEDGELLCSAAGDVEAVLNSDMDTVQMVGQAALKLNGLLQDDDDEEPGKND